MNHNRNIILETYAKPIWLCAMVLAWVTLFRLSLRYVRCEERTDSAYAELARVTIDINQLDGRIGRLSGQVHDVAKDVATELERKEKLHVEMAEVLSRAKSLQGERDRFQMIRDEVLRRFQQMDQAYMRAQPYSGQIQPR
jgi:chromosome segregation ATPase